MSVFLADYTAIIVKTCEKHIVIGGESNSRSLFSRQLHTYGIVCSLGNMLILFGNSTIRQSTNENIFVSSGLLNSILNAVDFEVESGMHFDDRYKVYYFMSKY